MMRPVISFLLLLSFLTASAQKSGRPLVDSLLAALPKAPNDTVKARLYNRVFNELTAVNADEAMQYARIGLAHAQKMNWPKGIAVFQNNLGQSYSARGNYDSTLFFYNAALKTHMQDKDQFNVVGTYNNMGTAAQNIRGDYTTAAGYYFKAINAAEEMNDSTLMALSLNNAARILSLQKNYVKALEFNVRALHIREKLGKPDDIAVSLQSIGTTYYSMNDLPKAKEYIQKALAINESSGNTTGVASALSNLALVYKDLRSVVETRIRSKALWDEVNSMHPEAISNTGNLGIAYLDIVRNDSTHSLKYGDVIPDNKTLLLQKAQEYLTTAIQLAGQTGDMDNKSFFTGALAEVQEWKGDFKNAYYNFKIYSETQDSIYSQENKNKIARAESQREIDQKNNELKINQLVLSNQRKALWGLIAGLALLTIIGILFYRQSRLRKKTNEALLKLNNELDNANKVKATFFAILSHDLRAPVANLISFLNLQKNDPGLLSAEQAERHQQKITTSAETLLENMETMLLWSKSQMEHFKPVKNTIAISSLFGQLEKTFAAIEGIQLNFSDPDNITLNTDEHYLFTIMHNLTANAVAALKNRPGAAISWEAKRENGAARLIIRDNGAGMPEEVLAMFNEDKTSLGSKTGLGLHIVKDMAKAIGCTVTVTSTKNGTAFELNIPA